MEPVTHRCGTPVDIFVFNEQTIFRAVLGLQTKLVHTVPTPINIFHFCGTFAIMDEPT